LACARFSPLPGILIGGEFPLAISGYNNDASSPFWQESTPFRLEFGNFRANFRADSRNSLRTAAGTDTVRHRAFSAPRPAFSPRLSPPAAGRRPPRAARLPGRTTSRAASGARAGGWREGGWYRKRSRDRKTGTWINEGLSSIWRAGYYCFTSCARIKAGSPREGLFRALPAHSPGRGASGVSRYTEWNTE
jgi:hypothetical protein